MFLNRNPWEPGVGVTNYTPKSQGDFRFLKKETRFQLVFIIYQNDHQREHTFIITIITPKSIFP